MEAHFPPFNTVGAVAQPPSGPISEVEIALGAARELSFRAQALADRLLGASPQAGEPAVSTPDGVLRRMQDDAERTRSVIEDGANAIARIEKATK